MRRPSHAAVAHGFSPTLRICLLSLLAPGLLLLNGCREEDNPGPDPLPTPTPFPNPTATPSPTPTPTPTPTSDSSDQDSSSAESFSNEAIAATSADIFSTLSRSLAQRIDSIKVSAENFSHEPTNANAQALAELLQGLGTTFSEMKASVFLVEPDQAEERASLPDPTGLSTSSAAADKLDLLREQLQAPGAFTGESTAKLRAELDTVIRDFEAYVESWKSDNPENFRNQIFLSDPDEAVGRIFQGVTTVVAILIPRDLAGIQPDGGAQALPEEIRGALKGVSQIFEGKYQDSNGALIQGSGLKGAVASVDPSRADQISAALALAMDASGTAAMDAEDLADFKKSIADLGEIFFQAASSSGVNLTLEDEAPRP